MLQFIDPETGRSKGFGFIQYKNGEDAKQALEKMNGFELAGRNVSTLLITHKARTDFCFLFSSKWALSLKRIHWQVALITTWMMKVCLLYFNEVRIIG